MGLLDSYTPTSIPVQNNVNAPSARKTRQMLSIETAQERLNEAAEIAEEFYVNDDGLRFFTFKKSNASAELVQLCENKAKSMQIRCPEGDVDFKYCYPTDLVDDKGVYLETEYMLIVGPITPLGSKAQASKSNRRFNRR